VQDHEQRVLRELDADVDVDLRPDVEQLRDEVLVDA
jgi:hypothetical protein